MWRSAIEAFCRIHLCNHELYGQLTVAASGAILDESNGYVSLKDQATLPIPSALGLFAGLSRSQACGETLTGQSGHEHSEYVFSSD